MNMSRGEKMKIKLMKYLKRVTIVIVAFFVASIIIYNSPLEAHASGWVKEVNEIVANYTKFPMDNYQLDFYVDTGWDWLPWQWLEGAVHGIYYGLYLLTNVIWYITLLLSYFTGFIVEQAYNLDFITNTITHLAKNMQTLAGVDKAGLKATGFYPMLLPWALLFAGGYFAYEAMLKKKFTRAMTNLGVFSIILLSGMAFISYSDSFLTNINDFSKDMNNEVLKIGGKLTLVNDGESEETQDGIVGIRENLFNVQIKMPYLLMQYDETDIDKIGVDRVESILELSPLANDSKRADVVEKEVGDGNTNMGFQKVPIRLGMIFLILILNTVISICVLIISGTKIFSEIMFIVYCIYLAVSFVMALFPSQSHVVKKNLLATFNSLMTKTGVTIMFTIMFSLSTMFYSITKDLGFVFMIFVQIIEFVGMLYKMNELLGFISISSKDASNVQSNMGSKMGQLMNFAMLRKLGQVGAKKKNARSGSSGGGSTSSPKSSKMFAQKQKNNNANRKLQAKKQNPFQPKNKMEALGQKAGNITGLKNKIDAKKDQLKDGIKNLPQNAKHQTRKAKGQAKRSVEDVRNGFGLQRLTQDQQRKQARANRRRQAQQIERNNRMNGKDARKFQPHTSNRKVGSASKARNPLDSVNLKNKQGGATRKGNYKAIVNESKAKKEQVEKQKNLHVKNIKNWKDKK